MESRKILLYFALKYRGDFSLIYEAIAAKEEFNEKEVNDAVANVKSNFVTILDDEYPDSLRRIYRPPFVLFYYGNLSILKDTKRNLAVVGSRENSKYGEETTTYFVKGLAKEFTIVSGMALGIDAIAHRTAINNGGKTVAVLGQGININYLPSNNDIYEACKKNHLVISEYPDNVPPKPSNFPVRNRIIVGLCDTLLVTEGKNNSGTQITALLMLEKGGDVCCVPTRIGENSICNHLIAHGAFVAETIQDIYEVTNVWPKSPVFEK